MRRAKPGEMSRYDMGEEEEGLEEARVRGSQIVEDLVDRGEFCSYCEMRSLWRILSREATCILFFYFSSTSLLLQTHFPPPSCTHAQSCNPMDFSPPDSSVHGFFQARILEWVAATCILKVPLQLLVGKRL